MQNAELTTIELNDGTTMRVRPIQDSDAERLLRFHETLSLESTRLRFFTPHPVLTSEELKHFTQLDHDDRQAFVVLDGDEIIAVARYDRIVGTDDAEIAFVVADQWQRKGIATALFPLLTAHALANRATCLVAETLAENRGMRMVFIQTGTAQRPTWDHGVAQTRMPIPGSEPR